MQKPLAEIVFQLDALKSELDSLRPFSEETEGRIWQKLRLDWNFHSNNLEGNSLTFGETKNLLLFGNTADGKPLKDHYEITGHNEAIEEVMDVVKRKQELTEVFIRQLHEVILKEPYKKDSIDSSGQKKKRTIRIGEYKRQPNHVKTVTGETFYFASPEETPAKMQELVEWFREAIKDETNHALLVAAELHYRFVSIHPFDDGNGRLSRLLMNFALMMRDFPPVIVKTQEKQNYFQALQKADSGDLEAFFAYIGERLIASLELFLKGAKGEEIDDEDDIDKRIKLLKGSLINSNFAGLSNPKRDLKNQEHIWKTSISSLFKIFITESEKYSPFYQKTTFLLHYYDQIDRRLVNNILNELDALMSTNKNFEHVKLSVIYENYNYSNHKVPDQFASMNVDFNTHKILIKISSIPEFQKILFYDSVLDNKEAKEIVKLELNKILTELEKNTKN